jgi:hypothetical protein
MPTDLNRVARALNDVKSVGQARAALAAAQDEVDRGFELAGQLSMFSTPDPTEARSTLNIVKAALAGERSAMNSQDDSDAVNPTGWERARRQVERAYIEVSGIEGVASVVGSIDVVQILIDAIADAPRVLGEAAGWVADAASEPVLAILTKLVENLWFWIVVAVLAVIYVKPLRAAVLVAA